MSPNNRFNFPKLIAMMESHNFTSFSAATMNDFFDMAKEDIYFYHGKKMAFINDPKMSEQALDVLRANIFPVMKKIDFVSANASANVEIFNGNFRGEVKVSLAGTSEFTDSIDSFEITERGLLSKTEAAKFFVSLENLNIGRLKACLNGYEHISTSNSEIGLSAQQLSEHYFFSKPNSLATDRKGIKIDAGLLVNISETLSLLADNIWMSKNRKRTTTFFSICLVTWNATAASYSFVFTSRSYQPQRISIAIPIPVQL